MQIIDNLSIFQALVFILTNESIIKQKRNITRTTLPAPEQAEGGGDQGSGTNFHEVKLRISCRPDIKCIFSMPHFNGIEQESIKSATLNLRPYKLQNTE